MAFPNFSEFWPAYRGWVYVAAIALAYLAGVTAALHALLTKKNPRTALSWIIFAIGFPGFGAAAYLFLGVNRIKTRARKLKPINKWVPGFEGLPPAGEEWASRLSRDVSTLRALSSISGAVVQKPLLEGCRIHILHNGEAAYQEMLQAIRTATRYIYLSSYIFETNQTGKNFIEALKGAAKRGCKVRVLLDGIGMFFSWPTAYRLLKRAHVDVARFLPLSLSERSLHLNLRNHRKFLLVDGEIGFTGGMNIGDRHLAANSANPNRVIDIHFRVEGPVLAQMEEVFLEDWAFATDSPKEPPTLSEKTNRGEALCRAIATGPNEDFGKLRSIFIGALSTARHSVRIMTPYFIPDPALIATLNTAALRGVSVDIALPEKNNLPLVKWASTAYLWELLQYGVKIHLQPPPFVHSKFLVIDDFYSLVGSANLDPRSLRLNFEFNLEIYDRKTAGALSDHFDQVKTRSHPLTLREVDSRSIPIKLRDAFARLFSPYL